MPKAQRIFTFNDPHPMRIDGALAKEIGLSESIVLLQLEYLISISGAPEHEGRRWTYQTLDQLHDEHFPFMGRSTIARTITSLERRGLIIISSFNKKGYDRTQWYALNPDGINKLHSIAISHSGTAISQNETAISHSEHMDHVKMGYPFVQNGTTIPETPTEISTERGEGVPAREESAPPPRFAPDAFDAMLDAACGDEDKPEQATPDSPPTESIPVAPAAPTYSPLAVAVAELCAISLPRASTAQKQALREAVEALREQNATPEQVQHFARYWRDKGKNRPPRPAFVVEDWQDAMYSYRPPSTGRGVPDDETPAERDAREARLYREYYEPRKTVHPATYRVASSGD